ncbi:MAG TPA: hypothetical protein VFI43_05040, partial [Nitrosospira sp.]|nr:hypothetical protein [Nitrosospira sp.]
LRPEVYREWLLRQMQSGVKVVVLGNLGFKADNSFLHHLGVQSSQSESSVEPGSMVFNDRIIGYEAQPAPGTPGFPLWRTLDGSTEKHLSWGEQPETPLVAVFSGQWGGVALHPYVVAHGHQGRQRWIINPFEFLSTALDLSGIPVPDVTTENGRRLLLVQIDGDGAGAKAEIDGRPTAMKVIQHRFLQKYPLPSTVSIIEGEIANGERSGGLSEAEKTARDVFKMNNVEIASHSYSHPSSWFAKNNISTVGDDYRLPISGYGFDIQREIAGSVEYINKTLAPEGKDTRVFLWTGDGLAGKDALSLVHSLGLENMNGGGATISSDEKTVTRVPPTGYSIDGQIQVYAPIASDAFYINRRQEPGFTGVIDTMQLTDNPLRLKPMHIHYHFYSGIKITSTDGLKSVYDWSVKQEQRPVWVSEYSQKVNEFYNITLSRRLDGAWDIRGVDKLRTLRLPVSTGWPDLQRSEGIVGVHDVNQGRYVHLFPKNGRVLLYTSTDPPSSIHLLHSNGEIEEWQETAEGVNFQVRSHVPLEMVTGPPGQKCYVNWSGGRLDGQHENKGWKFIFPVADPGNATLVCY